MGLKYNCTVGNYRNKQKEFSKDVGKRWRQPGAGAFYDRGCKVLEVLGRDQGKILIRWYFIFF